MEVFETLGLEGFSFRGSCQAYDFPVQPQERRRGVLWCAAALMELVVADRRIYPESPPIPKG